MESGPRLEDRTEIETQIAEGYASAQRGELIGADQVRTRLSEYKRTRLPDSPPVAIPPT
jgi:hypothetical protein